VSGNYAAQKVKMRQMKIEDISVSWSNISSFKITETLGN